MTSIACANKCSLKLRTNHESRGEASGWCRFRPVTRPSARCVRLHVT
jgi:hypothetical protein